VTDFLLGCVCGGLIVGVLALTYICGDERGFLSGTYLDRLLRDYERMKREQAAPPARSDWQDDGL
jgi:hypothetical protein